MKPKDVVHKNNLGIFTVESMKSRILRVSERSHSSIKMRSHYQGEILTWHGIMLEDLDELSIKQKESGCKGLMACDARVKERNIVVSGCAQVMNKRHGVRGQNQTSPQCKRLESENVRLGQPRI